MRDISAIKGIKNKMTLFGFFGCFLIFGLLVAFFYSPVIKTHADDNQEVDVRIRVNPVINLSLDKRTLDLEGSMNSFVHGSVYASVITNSEYGYSLGLEDADDDSSMHHTNNSITDVVTSNFSGSKTSAEMDNNTWGFSLDKTNYYYVPKYGITARIRETGGPLPGADVTEVDFGVKVGVLTSGDYTDTVLFSAYVNGYDGPHKYMPAPGIIPTMQNFTDQDCYDMQPGSILNLTDERDGKSYRVLKTNSYNQCWMVDNLSLETDETLTNENATMDAGASHTMQYASSITEFRNRVNNGETNLAYIDPEKGGFYTRDSATAGRHGSICPSSWVLPDAYDWRFGGDFDNLFELHFDSSVEAMRVYFPATDGYIDPASGFADTKSMYWSTDYSGSQNYVVTLDNSGTAYELALNDYGVPIRCIKYLPK